MNVSWDHAQGTRDVLAADPLFRQRADCLDLELIRNEIAAAFPDLGTLPQVEAVNVWYVPRKSLQVVYRAIGLDRASCGETVFRISFLPEESELPTAAAAAGDGGRILPRLGAVGWVFPDDAELPQLRAVVDDESIAQQFGRGARWRLLSYLPGRRCALHFEVPGDSAGVVLRVQAPEQAEKSHALAQAAWNATSRGFRMPQPLGYDAERGAFWERFAPGERVESFLGTAGFRRSIEKVVEGVVRLHAVQVPNLPVQGSAEVLKRTVARTIPMALAAFPALGAELESAARLLKDGAARIQESQAVTLHGDLHTANLLVDGEGVVFIDLDRMCLGNPAYDLALLGTRLLLVSLQRGLRETADLVAALPDLYRAAGGSAVAPESFAWHVAALLVGRQIKPAIRHLAPGAGLIAKSLLAWALRTLERGKFDSSMVTDDFHEVGDACKTAHAA